MKWSIQIGDKTYHQKPYSVANFQDIPEYVGMEYKKRTDNYPYGVMLHKFKKKIDKISMEFDKSDPVEIFPDVEEIVCFDALHICGGTSETRFVIGTMANTMVFNKE